MKILRTAVVVLGLAALMFAADSCKKDEPTPQENTHPLVGTWKYVTQEGEYKGDWYQYSFNADKTGVESYLDNVEGYTSEGKANFSWETSKKDGYDYLTMTLIYDDETDIEELYYKIEGNKLYFGNMENGKIEWYDEPLTRQ